MLVIRLFRTGKKNQPTYKIVVTEKKNPPKGGRFVEEVGFYNPKTKERILKKERIQYWISQGVQPSDTVFNMLVSESVIEGKKKSSHKKSKKEVKPTETQKEGTVAPATKVEEKPVEALKEEPALSEIKHEEKPVEVEPQKEETQSQAAPEPQKEQNPEEKTE
jgi:small subunit ribosomal protein S16